MSPDGKKAYLQQVARHRLEAMSRSTESDDLAWAATWMVRDPTLLLLEFARMVKACERVPSPLMRWLADAAEASMLKSAESRGDELLIELGLKLREGRPRRILPPAGLLRIEHRSSRQTLRALAKKYGVSIGTVHARLREGKATRAEVDGLLRGAALIRLHLKR